MRFFGRSAMSTLARTPVLVLRTTGRRSGRTRATVLAYHRLDEQRVAVVGGASGQQRTPDWVANLRAAQTAEIVIARSTHTVRAVEVGGPERDVLWAQLSVVWPRIESYRARAGRTIPVFVLTSAAP